MKRSSILAVKTLLGFIEGLYTLYSVTLNVTTRLAAGHARIEDTVRRASARHLLCRKSMTDERRVSGRRRRRRRGFWASSCTRHHAPVERGVSSTQMRAGTRTPSSSPSPPRTSAHARTRPRSTGYDQGRYKKHDAFEDFALFQEHYCTQKRFSSF